MESVPAASAHSLQCKKYRHVLEISALKCWIGKAQVSPLPHLLYDHVHRPATLTHIPKPLHQPLFSNITAALSCSVLSSINGGCVLLDRLTGGWNGSALMENICFDSDLILSIHLVHCAFPLWQASCDERVDACHLMGLTAQIMWWHLCSSVFITWVQRCGSSFISGSFMNKKSHHSFLQRDEFSLSFSCLVVYVTMVIQLPNLVLLLFFYHYAPVCQRHESSQYTLIIWHLMDIRVQLCRPHSPWLCRLGHDFKEHVV